MKYKFRIWYVHLDNDLIIYGKPKFTSFGSALAFHAKLTKRYTGKGLIFNIQAVPTREEDRE